MSNFVWPAHFACTIITENVILPNSYIINIGIEPVHGQHNIAIGFRKIRHFVENYLHNSIFAFKDSPIVPALEQSENNLVLFPTEPYDYFVGSILFTKFATITEKYFDIGFISIDSAIGDHVQYTIEDPEESGLDLSGNHWWNMDTVNTGSDDTTSWDDLDINDGPKFEPKVIKGGLSEN